MPSSPVIRAADREVVATSRPPVGRFTVTYVRAGTLTAEGYSPWYQPRQTVQCDRIRVVVGGLTTTLVWSLEEMAIDAALSDGSDVTSNVGGTAQQIFAAVEVSTGGAAVGGFFSRDVSLVLREDCAYRIRASSGGGETAYETTWHLDCG